MPVSALPSKYGIGTFGKAGYDFVDFLEKSGNKLWQILPLGPTGYGDSPYQSFSTFAGNPYFIDPELLIRQKLLTRKECDSFDFGNNPGSIDYEKMYFSRFKLLKIAYNRAKETGLLETEEYDDFEAKNLWWLEDYALFMAVKDYFHGVCFLEWDEDIRLHKKKAVERYSQLLQEETGFYRFQQFLFKKQWMALKSYANDKGIEIVGDIPIYVAFDSADTWANPKLFQLNEDGKPTGVAGVPPDYFAVNGQLWGNPLYNWKYHKKTEYEWWIQRISYCFELYDVVRIDHFRGFDSYWFVPYGDETAAGGHWEKGPGLDLFSAVKKKLGKKKIIAEDLGFLTDSVIKMVHKSGFPSMKVLQFGFDSDSNNSYLPHNYGCNCVAYTGTHDNDTTAGWVKTMAAKDAAFAMRYLGVNSRKELTDACIRAVIASSAETAIVPLQDYLKLGKEARINTPSTLGNNWMWRLDNTDALTNSLAKEIRKQIKLYGRL